MSFPFSDHFVHLFTGDVPVVSGFSADEQVFYLAFKHGELVYENVRRQKPPGSSPAMVMPRNGPVYPRFWSGEGAPSKLWVVSQSGLDFGSN